MYSVPAGTACYNIKIPNVGSINFKKEICVTVFTAKVWLPSELQEYLHKVIPTTVVFFLMTIVKYLTDMSSNLLSKFVKLNLFYFILLM